METKIVKRDYKKGDKIITYSQFAKRDWDKGTVISCDGLQVWYKDRTGGVHVWRVESCRLEEVK